MDRAVAAAGRLDVLVNNAGIIRRGASQDSRTRTGRRSSEVDLNAVFRTSRAMGRYLLAGGRPGKIVNVASLLSFQGGHHRGRVRRGQGRRGPAHEGARERVGREGHRRERDRARLHPHRPTRPPLQADKERCQQILGRIPAGRWGEPEDLKGAVVFLSSAASDFVHGHVLVVDGGWMGR